MDFGGFREASWDGKSSQDRSKIDPKKHQKNDEKMCVLEPPEGGEQWTRHGAAGILGPPNWQFSKKIQNVEEIEEQSTERRGIVRHSSAQARKRGGGYSWRL